RTLSASPSCWVSTQDPSQPPGGTVPSAGSDRLDVSPQAVTRKASKILKRLVLAMNDSFHYFLHSVGATGGTMPVIIVARNAVQCLPVNMGLIAMTTAALGDGGHKNVAALTGGIGVVTGQAERIAALP